MASSHRVTDLEKVPVGISEDEAPTPLLALVYFLLVISSFSNLVRCVAFQSFSFCLLQLSQQAISHQGACLLLGVLFYFPNLSLFVSSYVKNKIKVLFVLVQQISDFVASLVRVWGWASYRFLPFTVFCLRLPFCFSSYIVHLRCTSDGVVSMFNETSHSFFVWGSL